MAMLPEAEGQNTMLYKSSMHMLNMIIPAKYKITNSTRMESSYEFSQSVSLQ